jgi:UDP-N-acetylmuramoyl-L-alanyl-D-glutamate--2,6-diaminopimelate ligase
MIAITNPESAQRQSLTALLAGIGDMSGVPEIEVSGLQLDSRKVDHGDLFVALHGHQSHGLEHAEQAISQGAAAIIYDPEGAIFLDEKIGQRVPVVPVQTLDQKLGMLADRFFGHPSRSVDVIGITGTNGKTSCSHFLAEALGADGKAGVIGTLGWGAPGRLKSTTHTTPDAIEVHRILNGLRAEGYRYVAIEASSHGLVQGRLNGVCFKGAVYTNLSRDHLDYHQTMEAYQEAKLLLLDAPGLKFVVMNAQDDMAYAILRRVRGLNCLGFCSTDYRPDLDIPLLRFGSVRHQPGGVEFTLQYEGESAPLKTAVYGDFNVENLTATMAVLLCLGFTFSRALKALASVSAVPGRMENIRLGDRGAVIDYAHTPNALASVLESMRKHCAGKLWAVFGCGGDRDRGKRPQMGAVADRLADRLVITDDNPRSEDPEGIICNILEGISRQDATIIRDRREAIRFALENSGPDDLVLIAGKGHENTQEIDGVKHSFSDRKVVNEILSQLQPGCAST